MHFQLVFFGFLIIFVQELVDSIPIHLDSKVSQDLITTDISTIQFQSRKEDLNITRTESILTLDHPLGLDYSSESTSLSQQIPEEILGIHLQKRDLTEKDSTENPMEKIEDEAKEARASIPFLPKQESEGQSSGGLIPGLPSMPGLPESSNTPTAIIGGFQMVLMPMPGLSMANIGSALQAGQQLSQMVPGMPSLPG